METAFYFYTIVVMLICIVAGTISLSAYFVSRKKASLYVVFFFLFYFLDLALIFQYEYLGMNTAYELDVFYAIDQPILKTAFAIGALESLWLVMCEYLDEHRFVVRFAPAVVFVVASLAIATLVPEGPWRQWFFYSMRQLFLLWCLGYTLFRYFRTKSNLERTRLRRQKTLFFITAGFVFCILLEDSFMILEWNPDAAAAISLLPLYISERNFSENFLMMVFAFFSLREAAETLRLRFKEPPNATSNPVLQQHIEDLLPSFSERHHLTAREKEILDLVLLGKDNQNIASELQLALGTVKAHVHNILKKTNHTSRQDLMQDFWKE